MKVLLVFVLAAVAVAEPPVPQQYLPPSSWYGAPTEIQDYPSVQATQYEAPSPHYGTPTTRHNAPSPQYGEPTTRHNAPSPQYGVPTSRYGPPTRSGYHKSATSASTSTQSIRFGVARKSGGRPSTKYGAPTRSSQLHTKAIFEASPQQYDANVNSYFSPEPSSQYGAPIATQYHATSPAVHTAVANTYGAPNRHHAATRHSSATYRSSPSTQYGPPADGGYVYARAGEDDMSEPASYQFQYDVKDDYEGTEFGHQEERDGEDAKGEYRVLLPDGRTQVVTYTADERGYIPEIRFEEPLGGIVRGADNKHAGY